MRKVARIVELNAEQVYEIVADRLADELGYVTYHRLLARGESTFAAAPVLYPKGAFSCRL